MANEFKVKKGLIVQGSGSTGDNTILDVQEKEIKAREDGIEKKLQTILNKEKQLHNFEMRAFFVLVNNSREKPWTVPKELNEFIKKLSIIGQKIQDKQKVYADLAIKTAKDSMVSVNDPNMNSYMVDGITNEESKNQNN